MGRDYHGSSDRCQVRTRGRETGGESTRVVLNGGIVGDVAGHYALATVADTTVTRSIDDRDTL